MVMPLRKANVREADFRGPNPTSNKTCGSQHSQSVTVGIKVGTYLRNYATNLDTLSLFAMRCKPQEILQGFLQFSKNCHKWLTLSWPTSERYVGWPGQGKFTLPSYLLKYSSNNHQTWQYGRLSDEDQKNPYEILKM